jgi:hypothetical protein
MVAYLEQEPGYGECCLVLPSLSTVIPLLANKLLNENVIYRSA